MQLFAKEDYVFGNSLAFRCCTHLSLLITKILQYVTQIIAETVTTWTFLIRDFLVVWITKVEFIPDQLNKRTDLALSALATANTRAGHSRRGSLPST